jgi:hypothetical protein
MNLIGLKINARTRGNSKMAIYEIIGTGLCGLQVRVGQGQGQTKYFAYKKHGGSKNTRRLAEKAERELEMKWGQRPGRLGLITSKNRSGVVGMRFEWRCYSGEVPYLYLTGNYNDATGKHRVFAYSVEKHGLDGVLAKAIKTRNDHGASSITLNACKKAIWQHYLDVSGSRIGLRGESDE